MSSPLQRVIVVGGGLGGLRAVEALRRRGYEGPLSWVGDEERDPYDRPPLSKQLLEGKWEPDRVTFRRDDGYDALQVDRFVGRRAVRLDAAQRRLELDDGAMLDWDGLVIATGASPRRLPEADLDGVFVLRTLDDALALRTAVMNRTRVAIIGAGFIGLEVAATCRRLGKDVRVLEALDVPLARVIGRDWGRAIANMHRDEGIDLRTNVQVVGFDASGGRVAAVRLAGGQRVDADVVVVGIGVRPNTDWLAGSGVTVEDGVRCDDRLATSVDHVVAAGDVANFPHPLFGERLRVEHWTNAVEQANAAVERLLSGPTIEPFSSVPYFWSDQFDVKIQFAGRYRPGDDVRLAEGGPASRRAVVLYGRSGKLTGVLTLSRPAQLIKYRRLIGEGAPFDTAG